MERAEYNWNKSIVIPVTTILLFSL